jgi:VWFA-related protein
MRAILLLAFMSIAFGQPKPQAQPGERLIRLNVAATDAKGDPVTDLSAPDIELREDGQVRPVVFFRFAGAKRETLALRPREISNHPGPAPTIILLDRWNETALTAASAWIDIETALQHAETVDNLFLYIFTNRGDLYPVNPLPGSDADLRMLPTPTPDQLRVKLDDAVRKLTGLRSVDVLDLIKKANTTFKTLDTLAGQFALINGRKNLIWVTHGIPLEVRLPGRDWLDFTPQVRTLSTGLSIAQISIYPVEQSDLGAGAAVGTLDEHRRPVVSEQSGERRTGLDDCGRARKLSAGLLLSGSREGQKGTQDPAGVVAQGRTPAHSRRLFRGRPRAGHGCVGASDVHRRMPQPLGGNRDFTARCIFRGGGKIARCDSHRPRGRAARKAGRQVCWRSRCAVCVLQPGCFQKLCRARSFEFHP